MVDVVELSISDHSELGSLRQLLARIPGVDVHQISGSPGPGEQGAFDYLQLATTAAGSGGALVLAIRTIPEFIRSRRRDVSVTVKTGDTEVTITAANAQDAVTLLEKSFDAGRP